MGLSNTKEQRKGKESDTKLLNVLNLPLVSAAWRLSMFVAEVLRTSIINCVGVNLL